MKLFIEALHHEIFNKIIIVSHLILALMVRITGAQLSTGKGKGKRLNAREKTKVYFYDFPRPRAASKVQKTNELSNARHDVQIHLPKALPKKQVS